MFCHIQNKPKIQTHFGIRGDLASRPTVVQQANIKDLHKNIIILRIIFLFFATLGFEISAMAKYPYITILYRNVFSKAT